MWRVAAARATAATLGVGYLQKKAENCGIVGVVGEADDARDVLLDGLSILQNRGYDSAGMATLKRGTNELAVTKYASKGSTADSIALVRAHADKHAGHHVGIAHTRWATHGGKTDENAHPHFDAKERVGVVHNGVIMNADVLREQLQSEGIVFRSQTDTEVIAQLIGRELDAQPDVELRDAVSRSLQKCEGTWGVAVLSVKDPESVVVACNGSPMNIGLAPEKTFIASETSAFNRHTKNFIAMSGSPRFEDGEIGVVRAGGTSLDIRRAELAPDLELRQTPAPHAHWMEREIVEQPAAIARALAYGGRLGEDRVFLGGLDRRREDMDNIKHLLLVGCGVPRRLHAIDARRLQERRSWVVSFSILSRFGHHRRGASERERARSRRWRLDETASPRRRHHDHTRVSAYWESPDGVRATQVGCGTSMNASLYGAKLMRDLGAFDTAQVMDASEVDAPDLPVKNGGVLAVSQSGETKDVLRCVQKAMGHDVTALSVVNSVGSIIARTTKLGVYLNAGRENAVASTKAFTTQVTVMALLACWFHDLRNENHSPKFEQLMASLHRLPISFGMGLRLQEQCKRWAHRLVEAEHIFILGKGYAEPIAREGALKIKECAYVHAEGLSGGAMKHGPFALISEDLERKTPIIMLILDDEHAHLMRTAAEEVKARHAEVFVITDAPHLAKGLDDDPIVIPRNGKLTALLAVLPLQFLAYELALLRGVNPDFPRHLAKSVTVD